MLVKKKGEELRLVVRQTVKKTTLALTLLLNARLKVVKNKWNKTGLIKTIGMEAQEKEHRLRMPKKKWSRRKTQWFQIP